MMGNTNRIKRHSSTRQAVLYSFQAYPCIGRMRTRSVLPISWHSHVFLVFRMDPEPPCFVFFVLFLVLSLFGYLLYNTNQDTAPCSISHVTVNQYGIRFSRPTVEQISIAVHELLSSTWTGSFLFRMWKAAEFPLSNSFIFVMVLQTTKNSE